MKKLKLLIATFAVAVFGVVALTPIASVSALDPLGDVCTDNPNSEVCQSKGDDAYSLIGTLVNTLLFIVGTLSVIMLIWGGIRYTTSAGNAANVTAAKNTITYAIVGLVVSFFAYAIVNWVLGLFD